VRLRSAVALGIAGSALQRREDAALAALLKLMGISKHGFGRRIPNASVVFTEGAADVGFRLGTG
jgi:hypothetical protein